MIFLTVGTYPLPFERLIRATDAAIKNGFIEEEVFAQIGHCTYKPQNMKYVEMLEKEAFDSYFHKASAVISHAGMQKYGEVVNKHQVATAHKFEELGHILIAYSEEELPAKLQQLRYFVPQQRKNQAPAVAARIAKFLNNISMFRKQS
jgi:UDP-N-acetylglucosamine transferase subunit ALG13